MQRTAPLPQVVHDLYNGGAAVAPVEAAFPGVAVDGGASSGRRDAGLPSLSACCGCLGSRLAVQASGLGPSLPLCLLALAELHVHGTL